jgi:anti-anti-sigma regulatory factor
MQAKITCHEDSAGAVLLRIAGDFDGAAALDVKKELDGLGSRPVVIDFAHVHSAQDLAIAVLARSISENVRLRGLGLHQERLLRYCGLATSLQQAAQAGIPG